MNIFLYNDKDQVLISSMPVTTDLQKIFDWLEKNGILNRYKSVMIAEKCEVVYNDGESCLEWS